MTVRSPWTLVAAVLAAVLLAGCTWSFGGLAGMGALALALVVAAAIGLAATQTGCEDDAPSPCLSAVEPCLSYYDPDAVVDESDADDAADDFVGPCLGAPLEDVLDEDTDAEEDFGPCLSPPLDVGPCLSQIEDVGDDDVDADTPDDGAIGRLDPAYSPADRAAERASLRRELTEKGVLPADVARRLNGKDKDQA